MAYVTEKRGVHYAVIYEGRNPVTGTERRRWHRCDDRADAKRLAAELTAARERQTRGGSSMTVCDYLIGYWLPNRQATIAASTHARESAAVAHYLLPHLGTTQLRRLRPEHVQTLCRRLAITGSRAGGPLAAKTILNLHQTLRAAFGDAAAHGLLAINPIDGVRPPDPVHPALRSPPSPILDRRRTRRVPRCHRRQPSRHIVPVGGGNWDAARRGARAAKSNELSLVRPNSNDCSDGLPDGNRIALRTCFLRGIRYCFPA